jgi:uncharacterized protein
VILIEFDWDPEKAASNRAKHDVTFEEAMLVFRDPLALSRADEEHSDTEERWITVGRTYDSRSALVVHTHVELEDDRVAVRIISARRPTRRELREYENG